MINQQFPINRSLELIDCILLIDYFWLTPSFWSFNCLEWLLIVKLPILSFAWKKLINWHECIFPSSPPFPPLKKVYWIVIIELFHLKSSGLQRTIFCVHIHITYSFIRNKTAHIFSVSCKILFFSYMFCNFRDNF